MKSIISTVFIIILLLFNMESQAKSFRTIEAGSLKLQVYNASEESFGIASVIISGKTDAVLIDAQFTLEDAEKVAKEIRHSGKKLKAIYISHTDPDFYFGLGYSKNIFRKLLLTHPLQQ